MSKRKSEQVDRRESPFSPRQREKKKREDAEAAYQLQQSTTETTTEGKKRRGKRSKESEANQHDMASPRKIAFGEESTGKRYVGIRSNRMVFFCVSACPKSCLVGLRYPTRKRQPENVRNGDVIIRDWVVANGTLLH